MKKFIFATDLHGDMQDYESVEALLKFCDIWQPDLKVFGGDLFDFRNIRIGASQSEKQESMASDVEAGLQFLNDFKPNVFLLGNHDKRLWDTAHFNESGIIADYAKQGVKDINAKCRKLKCKIVEYKADKGYYDFGKVRFIHGYHAGIYATKKHAEIYCPPGGIVLHGHTHAIQFATIPRIYGGQARSVGCLANLDMPYNIAQTGRMLHSNGFAYGWINGKDFETYQAKKGSNNQWHLIEKTITI